NPDICPEMAENCGADSGSGVLEIGPGIGVLTKELCLRAKKVVSIELDKRLLPILDETVGEFDNLKIINADVMKTDLKKVLDEDSAVCPFMSARISPTISLRR
ncbi:MAG: 16S rRNA (adenine(1518)-N(6)/adenine(1519)-N(6))-dimethyltransferase, partial [Clostridia bacterium]|nr:16S rRNA (adenine(1518)-N(6)/adenine(1519)-N(6))-dimethyltransferase [Clostridia bacterium]